MIKVPMYKTSDGDLHLSFEIAQRHAENRLGDAITKLANELVRIEKYSAMVTFIEANIERLHSLKALQEDAVLVDDEDQTF